MKTYKIIIVGNPHELQLIEHAINTHFSRYYKATLKRETSGIDSITFSIELSLMWYETIEKILTVALYRGLKDTDIFNNTDWFIDTL